MSLLEMIVFLQPPLCFSFLPDVDELFFSFLSCTDPQVPVIHFSPPPHPTARTHTKYLVSPIQQSRRMSTGRDRKQLPLRS